MVGRYGWFTKAISLVTVASFLAVSVGSVYAADSTAVTSNPQTTVAPQAAAAPQMETEALASVADQAKMDAKADVKGGTWFVVGCLLGLVGWIIAYVVEPNPPATRLLGKSADYVAVYTDAYKKEAKSLQARKALSGCLVGEAISILVYVIVLTTATPQ
jgi:hypothetical protein